MIRGTAALAALALVTVGCGAGSAVSDFGTVFTGAKGQTTRVELGTGQRFSLAVPDNASVGDSWALVAVPDPKVASYISEEHESDGGGPGSGGTTYFVFNAKRPGTAEIRLHNCWRCGTGRTPSGADSVRESGEAIFRVTVKKRG
ncbi:protease inhibitor I42 family protein [Nonomuraea sp. LPB2021202275-12-8]|uniref:protease inhibitor I42 family protein n=1 Tax=Nonomuraea sp. LPB2021202275-12-8 TaxID=3120159 RepID=UPI00300C493B